MNTTSRFLRRYSNRFGMVPGDTVFLWTIISIAINWNVNLTLISEGAFYASPPPLPPPDVSGYGPATYTPIPPYLLLQQIYFPPSQYQRLIQ